MVGAHQAPEEDKGARAADGRGPDRVSGNGRE